MFHRLSNIIILLLVILYNSRVKGETPPSKDNEKLSENTELQMCIDSFDIYKDKIIRTRDSQGMGAKYLNEIDVDSRQECLRLCCETDECDVFIFEEKKPWSCYLFHCGQPHDFKCKFTSHANYSSAVLTNINYHGTAALEEQIRKTQQEHELKSLRKLSEPAAAAAAAAAAAPLEYSYTEAPRISVTQAPKILIVTTPVPIKTGCSRNQYECRTSGDCIAIYNVCDGIPQCADASDEASELGCPTEKPTSPSISIIHETNVPQTSQILSKYPSNLPHRKNYPPIYPNEPDNSRKSWQSPDFSHQTIPQRITNLQYPDQQGIAPISQINYGPQGYIDGWDYRQTYERNKESYNVPPNQLHPKNNELTPYEEDQPRIFKHKNPGVVAQSAGPEANSFIDSNRSYGSYYPLENHAAWQEGQQPQVPSQQPEPLTTKSPKLEKNRAPVTREEPKTTAGPVPCKSNEEIEKQKIETNKEMYFLKPSSEQSSDSSTKEKHIEPKEHEIRKIIPVESTKSQDRSTKTASHESVQGSKTESKIDKAPDHEEHKKIHEERKTEVRKHHFVAEHLQQNNHRSDNEILRPKGAVISLALGLTVTAIMAALIACRLRVVRRRGRRGHGPYAHDADYLVNGMYL